MNSTFYTICAFLLMSTTPLRAQDVKKEAEVMKTKMDVFASKTGVITKFIDTKLPNIRSSFTSAETRIRQVTSGNISLYFYQIERKGSYGNSTASIEYDDLLEVIKALELLTIAVTQDIALKPDYLENKFVTADGFEVGYYVQAEKVRWYIKLEKYGSDNTLFIDKSEAIETAFIEAKNKINQLRK